VRALTWQGKRDVRVEDVPDPTIQSPTDAIIRVTSSGICGSDLHLYEVLGAFLEPGDVLGHEPMGVVEAVGSAVTDVAVGDRIVVPFQIFCGSCWFCEHDLQTQCETTQVREHGMGAALYGYTKLYGQIPGGQAEYLRVPHADATHIKVPDGPPDDRFVYLSDVAPTAYQAVAYADVPKGGTVAVLGLGPIGDMACRIAHLHGARVIGIDDVPERLARVRALGIDVISLDDVDDVPVALRELTDGRGPDAVIDAVGMEASGSPAGKLAQQLSSFLPDAIAQPMMEKAGVDRLAALYTAIEAVRRGGTISLIGVYGGEADPLPMLTMFDKQIQLRMGQANVKRWLDDLMPLVLDDDDPLGTESFATHHLPLEDAPHGYEIFQEKRDNACKVLLRP
jgi:threonine dehydrogenase-like Zn-dependent dehydrogenase